MSRTAWEGGSVFGLNTLIESTVPEIYLPPGIGARVGALPWDRIAEELDEQGCAVIEKLLVPEECGALTSLYPEDGVFRSRVVMARHGFGRGEYKYFSYPLPRIIANLRTSIYFRLAPIANRWNEAMGIRVRFPAEHADFIRRCHEAGQLRPTPLLLQYEPGDYNCLHQDLYGEHVFPIQLTILLSEPGRDFTGGGICFDRAAAPHAVASASCASPAGGCCRICCASAAGAGYARGIQGQFAPRCQPPSFGPSPYGGDYFSRCELRKW
jgi:uncharacterized protein